MWVWERPLGPSAAPPPLQVQQGCGLLWPSLAPCVRDKATSGGKGSSAGYSLGGVLCDEPGCGNSPCMARTFDTCVLCRGDAPAALLVTCVPLGLTLPSSSSVSPSVKGAAVLTPQHRGGAELVGEMSQRQLSWEVWGRVTKMHVSPSSRRRHYTGCKVRRWAGWFRV